MEKLIKNIDQFVDIFYEDFFERTPEIAEIFRNSDLLPQKKQLREGLLKVIEIGLDSKDIQEFLIKLGTRHTAYEVKDEHYTQVKASLLKAFREVFADEYNEELNKQFTEFVDKICDYMIIGAQQIKEAS